MPNQPQHHRRGPHVFLEPNTAIRVLPNGDISFRMTGRPGWKIAVALGNDFQNPLKFELEELGTGLYEKVLPNPGLTGPQRVNFSVNDVPVLHQSAPLWYHANALCNYVELPDPETDDLIAMRRDIPHGTVSHETFYSEAHGEAVNSIVYTPPGYEKGGDYPVLYLFHEIGENKAAWTDAARYNFQLDNMIADGLCKPFIVVENDCTMSVNYKEQDNWYAACEPLERMMLEDCPRAIEARYRARPGKWNRAISGFGLGAVQAAYIGMRNPAFFGSIGLFTAFWPTAHYREEGRADPMRDAAAYIGSHPEEIKVFFRSEGELDMHHSEVPGETAALDECGVTALDSYVFQSYRQTHNWGCYRRALRDFAPLLFRDENSPTSST